MDPYAENIDSQVSEAFDSSLATLERFAAPFNSLEMPSTFRGAAMQEKRPTTLITEVADDQASEYSLSYEESVASGIFYDDDEEFGSRLHTRSGERTTTHSVDRKEFYQSLSRLMVESKQAKRRQSKASLKNLNRTVASSSGDDGVKKREGDISTNLVQVSSSSSSSSALVEFVWAQVKYKDSQTHPYCCEYCGERFQHERHKQKHQEGKIRKAQKQGWDVSKADIRKPCQRRVMLFDYDEILDRDDSLKGESYYLLNWSPFFVPESQFKTRAAIEDYHKNTPKPYWIPEPGDDLSYDLKELEAMAAKESLSDEDDEDDSVAFVSKSFNDEHWVVVPNPERKDPATNPYSCERCGERFLQAVHLRYHLHGLSGEAGVPKRAPCKKRLECVECLRVSQHLYSHRLGEWLYLTHWAPSWVRRGDIVSVPPVLQRFDAEYEEAKQRKKEKKRKTVKNKKFFGHY
ncbi:hypothetical protein B4U79_16924 [Dinothrombium tinctorium]|uniref:C2H2-type domain-containing protein n=1 Tax=Dinothrombium tinctorium TaxID=1965070 RepID=A0A3S3PYB5_9ACAR|nr:hypothetical protein B4U79_16924 [Dinothrombium tinctorium]